MQKVIVTGGAGFIGSNLAELLLKQSYDVVAIDNLSYGSIDNIKSLEEYGNFHFIQSDIRQKGLLEQVCQDAQYIIHLAAYKIPRHGNWLETLMVNNDGTKAVLECACRLGIKTVVASTSDVYGKNNKLPFTEADDLVMGSPIVRRWAYAASKVFDEQLAMAYYDEQELPVVILRFFGSYGPHNHRSWWGGPQAIFIEQALKGEPLAIHGDGKQTRSFCYVSDTIEGIKLTMESDKAIGQIINIGSAREIDILTLAQIIVKMTESKSKIQFVPYRELGKHYEDVRRRIPDLTKVKRLFGYEPKVPLEEGLKRTIKWHRGFYS
jgi:UDP-glucose 4-epimerase